MKVRFNSIKTTLLLLLLGISSSAFAQSQASNDKLIMVTGTVLDKEDKSVVLAKVYYEKLPYYDDMGIANTNQNNGVYELHMIENQKYIINVKATGYEPVSEEIEIVDLGIGLIEKKL